MHWNYKISKVYAIAQACLSIDGVLFEWSPRSLVNIGVNSTNTNGSIIYECNLKLTPAVILEISKQISFWNTNCKYNKQNCSCKTFILCFLKILNINEKN